MGWTSPRAERFVPSNQKLEESTNSSKTNPPFFRGHFSADQHPALQGFQTGRGLSNYTSLLHEIVGIQSGIKSSVKNMNIICGSRYGNGWSEVSFFFFRWADWLGERGGALALMLWRRWNCLCVYHPTSEPPVPPPEVTEEEFCVKIYVCLRWRKWRRKQLKRKKTR